MQRRGSWSRILYHRGNTFTSEESIIFNIMTCNVQDGEAICTQRDPTTGHDNVVSTLTKGHYFGEIALLDKKHRQASVRVAPNQTLRVLSLDQATFKRILGPLDPILRRNMDNYNKFHARDI